MTTGKKPSTMPKLVGMLQIALAALGSAVWLVPLLFTFGLRGMLGDPDERAKIVAEENGEAKLNVLQGLFDMLSTPAMIYCTVFLVLSFALGVAGVGLFRYREWGRKLTMQWAIVVVVIFVAMLVHLSPTFGKVSELVATLEPGKEAQPMGFKDAFSTFFTFCGYPILAFFLMTRREVKNTITMYEEALRGQATQQAPEAEEE